MATAQAYLAFSRFGLGPRAADLAAISDPRAALRAEIAEPSSVLLRTDQLPNTAAAYAMVRQTQLARQQNRAVPEPMAAGAGMDAMDQAAPMAGQGEQPNILGMFRSEAGARMRLVRRVDIGFGERLVAFWSNHFALEAGANQIVRALAGPFEREAIRPNVLGRFSDMLLAVTQHPAMLSYLNNAVSIGPDSRQGQRRDKGLNENHARELLELHTIGADGGYVQADVTALANVLTGWSFGNQPNQADSYGAFTFRRQTHQPGPQTIMGRTYAQPGERQGRSVLLDLAAHPNTARHLSLKLARHFVAYTPPPALVDRLAAVFLETGGDLQAVSLALIDAEEAWTEPATKLKSPQEFMWSAIRALEITPQPQFVLRALTDLGQSLWDPNSPEGFKDDVATWLAPNAMTKRLALAELLASQSKSANDPRDTAAAILGPILSEATRTTIERAESREQALALMLMSPEFQRR